MFSGAEVELQAECLLDRLYTETIPAAERRAVWYRDLAARPSREPSSGGTPSLWRRVVAALGRRPGRRDLEREGLAS